MGFIPPPLNSEPQEKWEAWYRARRREAAFRLACIVVGSVGLLLCATGLFIKRILQ